MYRFAVLIHVLGIVQWVTGQLALSGLLRRKALLEHSDSKVLADSLKGLRMTTNIGIIMTLIGVIAMLGLQPSWGKFGFVHTKVLIFLILGGLHGATVKGLKSLESGEPTSIPNWIFQVSLLLFVVAITLGVLKPF